MADPKHAAIINAAVARAMIRAMGMQADNMECQYRGASICWAGVEFERIIDQEGLGQNAVMLYLNQD